MVRLNLDCKSGGETFKPASWAGPHRKGTKVSYLNKGLMIGAALAAMSLSACATEDFVKKQVAPANALANEPVLC